jgi:photosystem II stability/assembly factor-like uncharacterized protein
MKSTLLLGTRKGFISYKFKNGKWQTENLSHEGVPVSIAYADPRTNTWWACLDHGHWGVKLQRSNDRGTTWEEVTAPAYPEGSEIKDGVPATTRYIWAMAHGGKKFPSRIWLGTDPGGLFLSEDNGSSFQLVESLWNHPTRKEGWFGGGRDQPGIHSVVVDPRNEERIHIGISCAGVFETTDSGKTWHIRNKGMWADFLPNPDAKQDMIRIYSLRPIQTLTMLWQQNHCSIFKSSDAAMNWEDVGQKGGTARFGFAIAVAEDNPNQAWVAPANSDTTRTAIKGALCICRTDDGGKSWKVQTKGLPQEGCFDIVYRHCLVNSGDALAFGTTTGNLFFSPDRGESWQTINNYLPMIYSVQFVD